MRRRFTHSQFTDSPGINQQTGKSLLELFRNPESTVLEAWSGVRAIIPDGIQISSLQVVARGKLIASRKSYPKRRDGHLTLVCPGVALNQTGKFSSRLARSVLGRRWRDQRQ